MNKQLHIPFGERAYEIVIGAGVLDCTAAYLRGVLDSKRVAIVTDERVADLHLERLSEGIEADGIKFSSLILPAGEATKSWECLQRVLNWLFEQKYERGDMVIAFGGGVIGDLVGFAAAVFRRGIGYVQIPTTLLAQVDSAVGGKTGINTKYGKNLIGAFHQPKLVLSDVNLLSTLPKRDFLSGYGEVVKYGLLADRAFFEWSEENGPTLLAGDIENCIHAVYRSCQIKAEIVLEDEKETGRRAHLNLGHTFGHALEAATRYSNRLLHGEGVAIGCVLAAELSARLGLIAPEVPGRIGAHLSAMGMKTSLGDIKGALPDADALIALMGQDKKVKDGKNHFVLMSDIGQTLVSAKVPEEVLRGLLDEALRAR